MEDLNRICGWMHESAEALVETLAIAPGMQVLDISCGDGTTALAEALHGADVLSLSIAADAVAASKQRAAIAGLRNVRFGIGDASNLADLADDRFDLVVTAFGAMFAPFPDDVAREMVRVARPGGRVVMVNAIPDDPTLLAQVLRLGAAFAPPPPPGFTSPMRWGEEATVRRRFERAGVAPGDIAFERFDWHFRAERPVSELFACFVDFCAPTMSAVNAAERAGRSAELQRELRTLFETHAARGPITDVPTAALKVTVTKR